MSSTKYLQFNSIFISSRFSPAFAILNIICTGYLITVYPIGQDIDFSLVFSDHFKWFTLVPTLLAVWMLIITKNPMRSLLMLLGGIFMMTSIGLSINGNAMGLKKTVILKVIDKVHVLPGKNRLEIMYVRAVHPETGEIWIFSVPKYLSMDDWNAFDPVSKPAWATMEVQQGLVGVPITKLEGVTFISPGL